MELFLELVLTAFLSLIFTFLFVKLVSMHPINTDDDELSEGVQIDRFQWIPNQQQEVIKLDRLPDSGKSLVEFCNEDVYNEDEFRDVAVVDHKLVSIYPINTDNDELRDGVKIDRFQWTPNEGKSLLEFHSEGKFQDVVVVDHKERENTRFELEEDFEFHEGERKLSEIEIESVEEEGEGIENGGHSEMDDWVEIRRKDFEELLGNRAGLHFDVASGK